MSRITGSDAQGMMEAYAAVYAPQELTEEQIWEEVENWVNSLLEEGYDLSEYTWEEMYEAYIEEQLPKVPQIPSMKDMIKKGFQEVDTQAALQRAAEKRGLLPKKDAPALSRPARPSGGDDRRGSDDRSGEGSNRLPVSRPSVTSKPEPAGQTGDKTKDMDTWAKANPRLAAAAAERARTRGTSATTNPLMKDMKSRMPSPTAPSPSTASSGFSLASKGVNLAKPATPTQATAAAPSTSPTASGSVAPATAAIASTPKPTPVAPKPTPAAGGPRTRAQVLGQSYEYDAYDLVLEYLLSEGHVETVDEAHYVMMEMDSETIQNICKR